jgi:hypothetical protein
VLPPSRLPFAPRSASQPPPSPPPAPLSRPQGDFKYEPSYNFVKQAPALAVSTSRGKDTYKASYDLKSETAALEWNRDSYKVVASASVNSNGFGKPSVTATYEQSFDL